MRTKKRIARFIRTNICPVCGRDVRLGAHGFLAHPTKEGGNDVCDETGKEPAEQPEDDI